MKLSALFFNFLESGADILFGDAGIVFKAITAKELARFRRRSGNNRSEWAYIGSKIIEFAMGETEGKSGFCCALSRITEDIATEDRDQKRFIKRARTPTDRRADEVRQVTHCQRLWMAAVTPVGIEIAQRPVFSTGIRRMAQIGKCGVMPAD